MKIDLNFPKLVKNILIAFVILIVLYYGLLFAAYLIPNSLIMGNWQESVDVIASEPKRWEVIPGMAGTRLDTFTDNIIFERLTNSENYPIGQAAVWNNGYYRYWMGGIPVIRFLLIFMNYTGIRYLNVFVIFTLFGMVYSQMSQHISKIFAFLFAFVLMMIQFWIFPLSLQYTPVYVITMITILVLIWAKRSGKMTLTNVVFASFIVGSVTNYFDLLTAPLLTFGLPFFVWFVLKYKNQEAHFMTTIVETFSLGLSWLIGFALTWVSKWTIGTLLLEDNVFKSAIQQIFLRTEGTEGEVLNFSEIMNKLLSTMFPNYVLPILLLIFLAWLIAWFTAKKPMNAFMNNGVLILISIVPFVWFFILQNHNQHHYYFTYRNLAITVLGVLTYLYLAVDWEKIVRRRKR